MKKIVNATLFMCLFTMIPTTTETISIKDYIPTTNPWTQQEVKNLALCAAVFAVIFMIYKKLPYTHQDPEFNFEDTNTSTSSTFVDENQPKVPVEEEVIIKNDEDNEIDDTQHKKQHPKETIQETGNLLEDNSSFISQVADFTW